MTPSEALQILDSAVSQLNASREVHMKLQEAIQVLQPTQTGIDSTDKLQDMPAPTED